MGFFLWGLGKQKLSSIGELASSPTIEHDLCVVYIKVLIG